MRRTVMLDSRKLNDYQKGRISGIIYALSGMPEKTYPWRMHKDSVYWIATFDGTDKQYCAVIDAIERAYPGVIFYTGTR